MELEQVKLQTTWNDAAGSINSNYAKIADAIAQLKANGGGGGGGADIDLTDYASKVWVEAQGYITASALTPYLKTEDAKETYATKDFVNNKLINYATIGSVTAIQNTLTGQIGAVGASVEQLAATKLDSSYFTLTNIKSTLGISDWALAATKPTYTASEVGALRLNESSANADLDTILDSKIAELKPFFQALTTNDVGSARKGVLRISYNGSESQLLFDHYNRLLRYRTIGENSQNWATIAFTSDIPTKLSQLTDDVVDGKYLHSVRYSDTWDADSIYSAGIFSGRISHLPSGEPYGRILSLPYYNDKSEGTQNFVAHLFITNGDDAITSNEMFFRTSQRNAWNEWNKVITDKNISNYNAGSADILATSFSENINYTTGESSLKLVRYVSDWESNGFPANYSAGLSVMTNYTGWQLLSYGGNIENPYFRSVKDDGVWKAWRQLAFLTDNVASATKLATRHKLWGNDFDGTKDVSGQMYVGGDFFIEHSTTGRQLHIHPNWTILGYNNPMIGNPTYVDGRDVYIRYGNDEYASVFASSGNVGIGNTSPTEKLDVTGNVKASGDITANKFIGSIRGDIIYDNGVDEGHFIGLGSNGVGVKGLLNYVYGNFPILFYTNGFERMRIGDYVGIGNPSPTERLDVSGNIKASGNINATSITINGVTITASNGTITVNGNVFAKGDITGGV